MRTWQQVTSWMLLSLIGLYGCDRSSPEAPDTDDSMAANSAAVEKGRAAGAPNYATDPQPAVSQADSGAKALSVDDLFTVESFKFEFHRETKAEVCGDWDYFTYNGSMTLSGKLRSKFPIDMTAADFELDLMTPFESFTLPAQRERETTSGDYTNQQVIVKKSGKAVFYVKDYRLDDDERVYRNDDDDTGTLKNYGPVINAMFDLEKGSYLFTIKQIELTPEDVEPGEMFEFNLMMPRADSTQEDFDRDATKSYRGRAINSDAYYFDGDCPD